MKKAFILAVISALIIVGTATADYNLSFTLINESGRTFKNVILHRVKILNGTRLATELTCRP